MTQYGIEYAHIYTDRQFGEEQRAGLEQLRQHEAKYSGAKRIVLIDDYSPAIGLDRFSLVSYLAALTDVNAAPDVVIAESALTPYCQKVLDLVKDTRLARSLNKYIATRDKYPCSLFVAAWYLLRLGAWGDVNDVDCLRGELSDVYSKTVVTILPYSYETPESQALKIIQATKFAPLADLVVNHYFDFTPENYSSWDDFDVDEYITRNYGEVLPEDEQIIKTCVQELNNLGLLGDSISRAIDVGMGGNLYPAMLLAPLLKNHQSSLRLQDFSGSNTQTIRADLEDPDYISTWNRFEDVIVKYGGDKYNGALDKVLAVTDVKQGSIFDLEKAAYDAVLSFFVAESITDNYETFKDAVNKTITALRPGGLLISTHMVGSEGYYAGERTSFPAVKVTVSDLEELYKNLPVKIFTFNHQGKSAARLKGYKGMALIIGRNS